MNELPIVKVNLPTKDILMPELERVLYSGQIGEGNQVYEFEKKFKKTFNIQNGLAVSSGTAALHITFQLLGLGKGDEVISTSMTAEPTNTSIIQTGATVVFGDVDLKSGNLSLDSIKEKVTEKTKAIVVVHYAGYPADVEGICKFASSLGIAVIEDCAHALGATIGGVEVGSFGDFAIYSFQAIKHMTTIDGGFLVCKNHHQLLNRNLKSTSLSVL